MNQTLDPQPTFRLTSIESLEGISPQVRRIAGEHGFNLEATDQQMLSAPFCGFDYFCQEMKLVSTSGCSAIEKLDLCLDAIKKLTDDSFADGFMEVLEVG